MRFAAGVRTLSELGVGTVIEVGPRAVLGPLTALSWPESETGPSVVSSLGRERGFAEGVAAGYEAGVPVSFGGLFSGERRRRVSLPTYPFQRERHWVRVRRRRGGADAHPLLGERRVSASGEITFETELSAGDPAWLGDHRVFGRVVVPGAFYAAQAVAAVAGEDGTGSAVVEEVRIERPLVLPEGADDGAGRLVQLVLGRAEAGGRSWEVFSRRSGEDTWLRHATGRLARMDIEAPAVPEEMVGAGPERLGDWFTQVEAFDLYQDLASAGIGLGPAFQRMIRLWSGPTEAFAELASSPGTDRVGRAIHPTLLDACFQTLVGIGNLAEPGAPIARVPVGWDRLWWTPGPAPERMFCHARLRDAASADAGGNGNPEVPLTWRLDLAFHAPGGAVLGGVRGLTLRPATRSALLRAADDVEGLLYEVAWRESGGEGRGALRDARFMRSPSVSPEQVAKRFESEGVDPDEMAALSRDLDRLSRSYARQALRELGWEPAPEPADFRRTDLSAPGHGGAPAAARTAAAIGAQRPVYGRRRVREPGCAEWGARTRTTRRRVRGGTPRPVSGRGHRDRAASALRDGAG